MSDDELRDKQDLLHKEIQSKIWHEEFWRDVNNRATLGLIGIAIVASATAGILGLLKKNAQIVGLVSFVPGAATLFATTFDFQKRATFHRRKARLLDELRGRFIYQMPTLASADQVALIHQELTGIEAKLAIDEDNIVVNFTPFTKDK
jgi:hypothetical protein